MTSTHTESLQLFSANDDNVFGWELPKPSAFSSSFLSSTLSTSARTSITKNATEGNEQQTFLSSNNNDYSHVSSLSMQKYADFIPSSFLNFNSDKNGPSSKELSYEAPFYVPKNSIFVEDMNENEDDLSLSEKSEMSNIFDDEESINGNNISRITNNQGRNDGNEQNLNDNNDLADVLDSVTMLLDGTSKDDFRNINNSTTSQQQALHSDYIMSSSSTLQIEPTPISTEPGSIQVIPKISSLEDRQEGPSLLSKAWYYPSISSKELLQNGHDHHHDIRNHVIKVLLNTQQQNSSSPPKQNEEKFENEMPAASQTTEDDILYVQDPSCTSKKRSMLEEWYNEYDNEDGDDLWFTTIDENTTLPSFKMEQITNEGIFAQPPPSRKKPRTDDDSDKAMFQPEYLENDYSTDGTTTEDNNSNRFRIHQAEQWWQRLQDIMEFRKVYGHCNVPNTFPENPILAQWVKRQRYQYKLKQEGKHSTLTDERETVLQNMGFIWDSHGALWAERWNELKEFYDKVGHSNVPTNYEKNRQLAIWVKCQRRQYKLYVAGDPKSNMTVDRIRKLELLDFVWHPKVGAKSAKEKQQYIIL